MRLMNGGQSTVSRRGVAALLAAPAIAHASEWPDGPLRIIIPFPPGGASDGVVRLLQPHLQARLGVPVVIDNRAGGGTTIGTGAVAQARDGRTFGLTTDAISVNPAILPEMPYDTIREIQGVMEIGTAPLLLAAATGRRPWRDAAEMLDAARRRQGSVSAGTSGSGLSNLFVVLASAQTGAGLLLVPYRGAGPLLNDALAGHVDLVVGTTSALAPHLRSGALRALVQAGATRAALLPDTPTFAELGFPEVVAEVSWGIIAATRMAPTAIAGMHAALAAALAMPDVRQQIEGAMAMRVIASSPAEYTRRIAADIARWTALVRRHGLRVEQ